MRRFSFLAVLAVLCHWQAAFAQIVVPAQSEPFAKIVALCQAEVKEGAEPRYEWRAPDGVGVEPIDGGKSLLIWAKPGKHPLSCKVTIFRTMEVYVPNPADPAKPKKDTLRFAESLDLYEATFEVLGAGPAPPGPAPGPTPPGPAPPLPAPVPGTLGALVPAEARLPLAEFYGDLATVVRSGAFATVGAFRSGQAEAVKLYQTAGKLPSVAAINEPINAKLVAAVGLDDAPLDAAKRAALATALDAIATEFRGS